MESAVERSVDTETRKRFVKIAITDGPQWKGLQQRPWQVTTVAIAYNWAAAGGGEPRLDTYVTLYGRQRLKGGGLGKDQRDYSFMSLDKLPDWVADLVEANRPEWWVK